MTNTDKIKTAFDRSVAALTIRPAIGQGTAVTKVCVQDGMTCEIEEGPWKLTADMSEKHGGNNMGPNPGVYGRAALGSCLAIGYVRWAANLGIPLTKLEIEVQADYDARGEFAVAEVPADYTEIRYLITIESPAPEEEILKMLDQADTYSSYFHVFTRPQKLKREVRINS